MSITEILGVIVAALAAVVGLVVKLWRGAVAESAQRTAERDAQAGARVDDAGRFEQVIADKNAAAAAQPVPTDIAGVRDAIKNLGGTPLPKGKP